MPWWRAYAGMPNHPIWRLAARRSRQPVTATFAVGMSLLDHASSANSRADRGDVSAFDPALCAATMDLEDDTVTAIIAAFEAIGWIVGGRIKTWEARQVLDEDPGGAGRQQRFRDNQAEARKGNVTGRNANVTGRNGPETDEEKIETQTEESRLKCGPPSPDDGLTGADVDDHFAEAWAAYPSLGARSNPRKPAREKYELLVRPKKGKGVDPATILDGIRRYAATKPEPQYTSQMIVFLNQERFNDAWGQNVVPLRPGPNGAYTATDLARAGGNETLAKRLKQGIAF